MNKIFTQKSILLISFILIFISLIIVLSNVFSGNSIYVSPASLYKPILPIILLLIFLERSFYNIKKNKYSNCISLENAPEEFENLYNSLYENNIDILETRRKKIKRLIILQNISLFFFILGIYAFDTVIISPIITLIILFIAMISLPVAILLFLHNSTLQKVYKNDYKINIINSFIQLLNCNLKYSPSATEADSILHDYKLAIFDKQDFNSSYIDDYIEGYLDDSTFVKMCDINVQYITGEGKSKNIKDLFQGMFALTNSNTDIKTYVRISRNQMMTSDKTYVELDNSEFEKHFDVFSPNKILAMQILTSDVMECLIDFHNKYHLDFEITIRDNFIYLRFFTGSMFEPKIYGNSMDKQLLFTYFCISKFIIEVTQKINRTLKDLEL